MLHSESRNPTLLIVDDEPQVTVALSDLFEDEFKILTTTSPARALNMLRTNKDIATIISDQRMPEMTGDRFFAAAREISPASRLLITGYADLEAVIRAVNEGQIFGYISKPWDDEGVRLAVHKAFEYYELRQQLSRERALLLDLMRNSPDGIAFKDLELRYVQINKVEAEILGLLDPESAVGKSDEEFLPHERSSVRQGIERKLLHEGADSEDYIERVAGADGAVRWYSVKAAPIRDESNEAAGLVSISRDVTEQMRADEALRESERRLREIAEHISEVFWLSDPEKREILYVSPAYERIWGRTCRSLYDHSPSFLDGIHPDDRERVAVAAERQVHGDAYDEEYRVVRPDGTERWVRDRAFSVRDEQGAVVRVVGIVEDISARRSADETLRRLSQAVEQSASLVVITDPNGVIEYVNPRFLEVTGYSADELLGEKPNLWRSDRTPNEIYQELWRTILSGEDWRGELENRRKDGSYYYVSATISPIQAPDGTITHYIGVQEDTTARRASQETLRKLSQAVEQSASLVTIANRDGIIEYANAKVVEVSGYDLDELIGRGTDVFGSQELSPEAHGEMWRTVRAGQGWRGEVRNRRKDGTIYIVSTHVTPIRNEDGTITHYMALEEDVTEARALEEQLRQAQKMEAVGQLTGGVAHDFNNLLMVIIGNLELLEERLGKDADERLLRWARAARRAGERGSDLTRRLLAFSRRQVLEPRTLDLNEVVHGMKELFARALGEDIDLEYRLAEYLAPVRLDPAQFENALLNLALNARDAMPAGGQLTVETAPVELDASYAGRHPEVTPGHYVMVAVSDTGTGIARESIERVFEPFFTTKEGGRGTGLGLSMVYGFVKQSGGHAKIYSELGSGTTIKLYFPIASSSGEADAERRRDSARRPTGGERILVVEDDPEVRATLETMLGQLGYGVVVAEHAADALRRLEEHGDIALLLTDVVMPGGMTGPELAAEVTARRPEIKVLFTSGYAEEALRRRAEYLSGANWLAKPYTINHLAERLRDVLDEESG